MTEEQKPPARRPLGERDEEERRLPFGSRPPPQATTPYYFPEATPSPPAGEPQPTPADRTTSPAPEQEDASVILLRSDSAEAEPIVEDEPETAPPLIRARDRRGRVLPGVSILKPAEPEPEPEAEAPSAAQHQAITVQFGVMLRTIAIIFLTAGVIATMFTWWTPDSFLPAEAVGQLSVALATRSVAQAGASPATPVSAIPAPTEVPPLLNRIGVVSGHRGLYPATGLPDPGAVCPDGLTEADVNYSVARLVVEWLTAHGYQVDLLDEFDPRLNGYQADVLVSIHADSCEYINDLATGFKVASFTESTTPEEDTRLVGCLVNRYAITTGLSFHPGVTPDMTQYHTFHEIAPGVPGAIIEIGFLYLDRQLLTEHPDVVALGVARGLLCYLRGEPVEGAQPASAATATP